MRERITNTGIASASHAQFLKAKSATQSAGKSAALIEEASRQTSLLGTGKVTKVAVTSGVTNESMVRKTEVRSEVRTESASFKVPSQQKHRKGRGQTSHPRRWLVNAKLVHKLVHKPMFQSVRLSNLYLMR